MDLTKQFTKGILEKVVFKLKCGATIDLDPSFVSKLVIYESMSQPGVTGLIEITDYQQLVSYDGSGCGGIAVGDEVQIAYRSGDETGQDPRIAKNFLIYHVQDYGLDERYEFNKVTIRFCSKWLIPALCGGCPPKYWKNKRASDAIIDVLSSCGCPFGKTDKTKIKHEIIVAPTCWSPLAFAWYYLSREESESFHAKNWVLYESLHVGVIMCTKKEIIQRNAEIFGVLSDDFIELNFKNTFWKGNAVLMEYKSLLDATTLFHGLFNSYAQGLWYDTDELWEVGIKAVSECDDRHVTEAFPMNSGLGMSIPKSIKQVGAYPQKTKKLTFEEFHKPLISYVEHTAGKTYSDVVKLVVQVPLSTKRKCGQFIHVNVLRPNKKKPTYDMRLTGCYYMHTIMTVFEAQKAYQFIVLTQDGYHKARPDMVTWKNWFCPV